MSELIMKTKRHYRLLKQLLNRPTYREQLDKIVGASNSPEEVRQLRELGWGIICERVPVTDRDGKPSRIGLYYLQPDYKEAAVEITKKWEAGVTAPTPQ